MAKATDLNGQLIENLEDSGFQSEVIDQFIQATQEGNKASQRKLLVTQKCLLREQLHTKQKQIDSLDYLMFKLKLQ